jgi:hypothetical protein
MRKEPSNLDLVLPHIDIRTVFFNTERQQRQDCPDLTRSFYLLEKFVSEVPEVSRTNWYGIVQTETLILACLGCLGNLHKLGVPDRSGLSS